MCTKTFGSFLTLSLVIWLHATSVQAIVVPYSATMNGEQADAGAGTGSSGTGTGAFTFNTDTSEFAWDISWSGLTGTPTGMHFHGPGLPDQNVGVQVGVGVASNPVMGSATLSTVQATELQDGLWYLNLHTTTSPGGEIRGQVVPEPSALTLAALGLLSLLGFTRRRRHRTA